MTTEIKNKGSKSDRISNWDFFWRSEHGYIGSKVNPATGEAFTFDEFWADRPALCIRLQLPENTPWDVAIATAIREGASSGNHRSGIREVQNDWGVLKHKQGRKINFGIKSIWNKVTCKSWDERCAELDAEDN